MKNVITYCFADRCGQAAQICLKICLCKAHESETSGSPVQGVCTVQQYAVDRISARALPWTAVVPFRCGAAAAPAIPPGQAPGLSGSFYALALKRIADTEHGVGTGPAPYRIDSVIRRAGQYLET